MAANIGILPPSDLFPPPESIYCVYGLSGTYGILPRILYYATLVFAIFGRTREWLVIGALVSALTYAGTSAIHAMALVNSKAPIFDLDIYGVWAVLTSGCLAYICMIHWSSTVQQSRARVVMVVWGFLVGSGLIFARSVLFDTPLSQPEPPCYSSTGKLLIYPIELISPQFNCTYKCFSASKPMRQPSEIMAVPLSVVHNKYSRLGIILVGPIMFVAYAAISWDSRQHTPSQLCTRWVMKYLTPQAEHEEILKSIYNASSGQWYGGYIVLCSYALRRGWRGNTALIWLFIMPWCVTGLVMDALSLPLLVVNIVLNEYMIMGSGLPTNEANYAIGQWGPIVASVLVVIAAIINKSLQEWENRQKRKKENRKRDAEANTSVERTSGDTESDTATVVGVAESEKGVGGVREEQTTGVVFKKLAHVETLRDAPDHMWVRKPKR